MMVMLCKGWIKKSGGSSSKAGLHGGAKKLGSPTPIVGTLCGFGTSTNFYYAPRTQYATRTQYARGTQALAKTGCLAAAYESDEMGM